MATPISIEHQRGLPIAPGRMQGSAQAAALLTRAMIGHGASVLSKT